MAKPSGFPLSTGIFSGGGNITGERTSDLAGLFNTVVDFFEAQLAAGAPAGSYVEEDEAVAVTENQALSLTGLYGAGPRTYSGTLSQITPTTGVASGTAGASTTPTSLDKPTAAANWTSSDLLGSFVRIVGGAGAGEVRPVLANTTTAIEIHAIADLDSTSVFELVGPDVSLTSLSVLRSSVPVIFKDLSIAALDIDDMSAVQFINCTFAPASIEDLNIDDVQRVSIQGCQMAAGARLDVTRCFDVQVDQMYLGLSGIDIRNAHYAKVVARATGAAITAVRLDTIHRAEVEVKADSCAVTPVVMASIANMTPVGSGLTGAANTGYGVTFEGSGRYDVTGATITGDTSDFRIENADGTWADLLVNQAYIYNTTAVVLS